MDRRVSPALNKSTEVADFMAGLSDLVEARWVLEMSVVSVNQSGTIVGTIILNLGVLREMSVLSVNQSGTSVATTILTLGAL